MCGIAGILEKGTTEVRRASIERMADSLCHRGPDGLGFYTDDSVALSHNRLSIIDLSEKGNQPLYNEDRSLVLVCNGEIYNYKEIRRDLEKKGHRFSSDSDSEVVLHLYEEHKDDLSTLLAQLTGMFAFALWDINRCKLFAARDRVGIKPLYYFHEGARFIFASEVKPVRTALGAATEIDFTSVYEYFLLGSIPGPHTLYKSVHALEAGHFLTFESGQLHISKHWDIPICAGGRFDADAVQEELEELLDQIVKDHLVADVPVGSFLSAGVDSSLITALAVGHHPGINSFTASFPGEPEDEGIISGQTAQKLKTNHFSFELKNDFFADFETQFRDLDQPFAIQSALALGRISKMARQHVKVVLSGDGGDELFGGYNRHEFPRRPNFLKYIPENIQLPVLKVAAKATGKKSLDALAKNLELSEANIFLHRISVEDAAMAVSLLDPDIAAQIDMQRFLRRLDHLFHSRQDADKLNRVLFVDMKTALIDEMLTKCDRMTMMNGIEGRVPFLDHRLVEFAFRLPGNLKRHNGVGKFMLRKFLAKKLGNELAYRAKTGFNSPFKQWLNNDNATKEYVLSNFEQVKSLKLLNNQLMDATIADVNRIRPTSVFAVVCLNNFFSNLKKNN